MDKKKVITIGGSSSKHSINKQLAEYTGSLLNGVELIQLDLNDYDIPLYSIDNEKENGFAPDLLKLNEVIDQADGFIISLAEHNGAYSAAFKNVFDWLSRINSKVWRNKPMLLLSTSPGARGGKSVIEIAKSRFPYNGADIVSSMTFPFFKDNFNAGKVVNQDLGDKLNEAKSKFLNKL